MWRRLRVWNRVVSFLFSCFLSSQGLLPLCLSVRLPGRWELSRRWEPFPDGPAGADAFGQFSQRRLADGMADSEDDLFIDVVRQGADVVLDAFVVDDAMDALFMSWL